MLTFCSIISVDGKSSRFVSDAVHKARSVRGHIGTISMVDIELKRTLCEKKDTHYIPFVLIHSSRQNCAPVFDVTINKFFGDVFSLKVNISRTHEVLESITYYTER